MTTENDAAKAGRQERYKAVNGHRIHKDGNGFAVAYSIVDAVNIAAELNAQDATIRELREKYHELLYAVGNAYPGETRHQTALRYIVEREASTGQAGETKQDATAANATIAGVRKEIAP